mgnify:CR=1 FL=1
MSLMRILTLARAQRSPPPTLHHPLRSRARIAEHRRSWIVELISPRLDLLVVHSSSTRPRGYPPVPRHMVFWPLLGMTETALALGGAGRATFFAPFSSSMPLAGAGSTTTLWTTSSGSESLTRVSCACHWSPCDKTERGAEGSASTRSWSSRCVRVGPNFSGQTTVMRSSGRQGWSSYRVLEQVVEQRALVLQTSGAGEGREGAPHALHGSHRAGVCRPARDPPRRKLMNEPRRPFREEEIALCTSCHDLCAMKNQSENIDKK